MELPPNSLRSLGVNVPPHLARADERRSFLFKQARAKLDQITKDTPPARADEIEREFDAMIAEAEQIGANIHREVRLAALDASVNTPDPRRPRGENVSARGVDDGRGYDVTAGEEPIGVSHRQSIRVFAEPRDPRQGVTLGGYLRAMVSGAQTDAERRALSEGTNSAGGFTVPDVLANDYIDLLRSKMVVSAAGARTIPLTSDTNYIAQVAEDPVPAWRNEAASVAEDDMVFSRVTLTPRSLALLTKVSSELLDDSLNIREALPATMAAAMAREVDRVALFGSGSAPEPRGVANQVGIGSIAHNAVLSGSGYVPLINARKAVELANTRPTAYILSPRDEATFAAMVDADGNPLQVPRYVADIPWLSTTAVETDNGSDGDESMILCGDFTKLLVGVRNTMRVEILRERYMDTLQFGYIVHLRVDTTVTHPAAFCKITGIAAT